MDVAEAFFRAGGLVDDLVATALLERATASDFVLEYLTNPSWPEDDPWWLRHLVESVQEDIQEDRINTAWPQCPDIPATRCGSRNQNYPSFGGCADKTVSESLALASCLRLPVKPRDSGILMIGA